MDPQRVRRVFPNAGQQQIIGRNGRGAPAPHQRRPRLIVHGRAHRQLRENALQQRPQLRIVEVHLAALGLLLQEEPFQHFMHQILLIQGYIHQQIAHIVEIRFLLKPRRFVQQLPESGGNGQVIFLHDLIGKIQLHKGTGATE